MSLVAQRGVLNSISPHTVLPWCTAGEEGQEKGKEKEGGSGTRVNMAGSPIRLDYPAPQFNNCDQRHLTQAAADTRYVANGTGH